MNSIEAVPRPPLGLILVRGLALLGLALALTLIVDLLLLALLPSVRDSFTDLFGWYRWSLKFDSSLLWEPALVLFFALAVFAVLRQGRPRSLREFVVLSLSAASIGVAALVLAALFPPVLDGFLALARIRPTELEGSQLLPLFAIVLLPPLVILGAAWWLRLSSWQWISGGFLLLAPIFAYLAVDDARINRPLTLEEFSPAFPGADQGYDVLMRYGQDHPLGGRNFKFQPPDRIYKGAGVFSPGSAEWSNWLVRNRADLEADWLKLAPVWAWWNELNAFDRLADLTPGRPDAEILSFQPIRAVTQHACAIASLQALDGHGDEALATLLPVLQVSRKLQPSSRTLVRLMMGRIVEGLSMTTADFILEHATVSPAAKEKLAAALAGDANMLGARRLVALQYARWISAFTDRRAGDLVATNWNSQHYVGQDMLNLISPFLYNPRHTINVLGQMTAELEDLAAHRESKIIDARTMAFVADEGRHLKNRLGTAIVINRLSPAYGNIVESYWKVEDERATLRTRLAVAATP
jgi:hypothetical protein